MACVQVWGPWPMWLFLPLLQMSGLAILLSTLQTLGSALRLSLLLQPFHAPIGPVPNYSFGRTAATGCATITRYARCAAFNWASVGRTNAAQMFAACASALFFGRSYLLLAGWPALQSTSAGGRLSQFARESALHYALHARLIVALRARLLKHAAISPCLLQRHYSPRRLFVAAGSALLPSCGLTIRSSDRCDGLRYYHARQVRPLTSSVRRSMKVFWVLIALA